MIHSIKSLGIVITCMFAPVLNAAGIHGIYVGSMHLTDGDVSRVVPLAISLNLNDNPSGGNYLDGSFVVDEEGGPYTFKTVSYDIDNNIMEMNYSRRGDGPTTLRFRGNFDSDFSIIGTVVSRSQSGDIGTFKLTRDAARTTLPKRTKYTGVWAGDGFNRPTSTNKKITIQIAELSGTQTTNPDSFELDYTPGRSCGYSTDGIQIGGCSKVTIDYLRRKVSMGTDYSLELTIDPSDNSMSGVQTSQAHGVTTEFKKLIKVAK